MNIVYINQIPYVTDKETFPTKPYPQQGDGDAQYAGSRDDEYREAVTDFIRDHCSPIREEDQEKVKFQIEWSELNKKDTTLTYQEQAMGNVWKPVDHIIYKIEGLELKAVDQYRMGDKNSTWYDIQKHNYDSRFEYRKAFKIVETKEI